jgi:predicted amidohydrolase
MYLEFAEKARVAGDTSAAARFEEIRHDELATRVLAEAGAQIIFVPSCTDERQGFCRVRYCAQARASENQIYVAMAGTVGNLPEVPCMATHYGQSAILTPSDYFFARDGIAAEGTVNQEQMVIADVDLNLLEEQRINGTVLPLNDLIRDAYDRVIHYADHGHGIGKKSAPGPSANNAEAAVRP